MPRSATPDILADLMSATPGQNAVVEISLSLLDDNPFQEREDYGDLTDLANDIREHGVLQPPLARMVDGRYQLAIGHRRKRACELANLHTMGVIVRALTDEEMATVAFSENEQRKDVSILDKARAIQVMQTTFGWTQQQIADKLSISRPAVANMLRLLRLPDGLQNALGAGEISARQAEALLAVHELPEEIKQRAESHWEDAVRPSSIVRAALNGASSDHIRDRLRMTLQRFGERVDERNWYRQEFTHPDVEAQRCDACPHAIRRDIGVYCPKLDCYRLKETTVLQHRLSLAAAAAGIPVADNPHYDGSKHESFRFSPYREILNEEPRCPNLRVVEISGFDLERDYPGKIDGHNAMVVCQKGGNHQCSCEMKRKRAEQTVNPTKTTPAVARAIGADAAQVLANALRASLIDPDLIRLLIGRIDDRRAHDDTWYAIRMSPETGDELITYAAENAMMPHVKEWRSPDANKQAVGAMLTLAGLPSPWEEHTA